MAKSSRRQSSSCNPTPEQKAAIEQDSFLSLKYYVGVNMATQYYQEMQESFKNNNKSKEFPAHTAKVHSVAWSCDGRRVASGSFDKTASVFVLEKDRLVSLVAC